MLQLWSEAADTKVPIPECEGCGRRMRHKGYVRGPLITTLGSLRVRRVRFRCETCHRESYPHDRHLRLLRLGISHALAGLSLDEFRQIFAVWLKTALADQEGRWTAAVDGKTCRQGLDAQESPVQMLSVFLQRLKLALDQWSIGNDKTNEPGSLKVHLAELLAAYPALQLLSGDAINAQRPLLDLFQVLANPPDILDALETCFFQVAGGTLP